MAAVKPLVMTSTGQLQRIQSGDAIPVSAGGTGATDAATARTNLGINIDTDETMAANSDSKIPSQRAVRAYVAANAGSGSGSGAGATVYTYANRGNLRALLPSDGAQAVIHDLGYFVFHLGSTELDDDQSCFVTSNGAWLMEAIGWGAMESFMLTIREDIDNDIDATYTPIALPTKFLYGATSYGGSTLTTNNSTTITVSVPGAQPGDRAFFNPPTALPVYLDSHCWVVTDAVIIGLNNVASTGTPVSATIPSGNWLATVIRQ